MHDVRDYKVLRCRMPDSTQTSVCARGERFGIYLSDDLMVDQPTEPDAIASFSLM